MRFKNTKLMRILVVMVLVIGMFSATAFATTDSVQIYLHNGGTDTLLATYSRTQLENFSTFAKHNYSSKDCYDAYFAYTAKGPELQQVLETALSGSGTSLGTIGTIKIEAADLSRTVNKSDLLSTARYYYNSGGTAVCTVPAILATKYAKNADVADASLSTTSSIRSFYGQSVFSEEVMNNYVKNITKITLNVQ